MLLSSLISSRAMAGMLLGSKGLTHYWRTHYADKTFEHLYRWNTFDVCLLVPYFVVMIILAFYGIHRYQLVWLYFKNKKNAATWDNPPARFEEARLPFVTIQLPIFNEQFVIDRLIDAVCKLNYPRDRFEIQVLDDSTDETVLVARQIVDRYAAGFVGMEPQPIVYLHRTNRHGYKAGALDKGLDVAKGDLIAIFDADFVSPTGVGDAGGASLRGARHRHGANSLDAPERRLQLSHAGRSNPARRPLCARAWRPLAGRRLLQLQRHGGHVAARDNLRSGRMAARHADRRHRPELSCADGGLEVQIPAGCRVPRPNSPSK